MRRENLRSLLLAGALIVVAAIAALWSWNTLATLFGGPEAEMRHVLAAATLALLARFALLPKHRRQRHAFRSRSR